MKTIKNITASCLLILFVCATTSWGFLVHKTTHQLAVYQLPKNLRTFYYAHMNYVTDSAARPDIRRNRDSLEASKHFIDLEKFGDSAAFKLPLTWNEAIDKYSIDTLLLYGYVPYQVLFTKERLTAAFRSKNADSIVFYSADIGHYIADAHVPLHTSVNYDGQLSNQKGLHSLWESMIPEIEISHYNLRSGHKAKYLRQPAKEIMLAIQGANALLPNVFGKEIEVSATFSDSEKYRVQVRRGREYRNYSSAFATAYAARLKNTINDQLLKSADLIADFWYTSWVDAGKPDLAGVEKTPLTLADKKKLKREYKSYRHNRLISDSLLKAKVTTEL